MKTQHIVKLIPVLLLCFIIQPKVSAQAVVAVPDETPVQYAISWQTSSLISGGWRFDFETRLEGKKWLRIAPTIYSFPSSQYWGDYYWSYWEDNYYFNSPDINSVFGIGLDLDYKYYLNRRETIYLLGGVHYSYINYKYDVFDFSEFEEDGFQYWEYDKVSGRQHFNRPGAIACLGLQTPKDLVFFFDVYFGIGCRYAIYNDDKPAFDDGIYSPGYRGIYFAGGFRMGIAFGDSTKKMRKPQ